jgi:cyclopropane-fatty-acyl-phospholipid synthase
MSRFTGRLVSAVAGRAATVGTLHVTTDGTTTTSVGEVAAPEATLIVHDSKDLVRRTLRSGGVGFAEAYIAGSWDTPDPAGLLELVALSHDHRRQTTSGGGLMRSARALWDRMMRQPGDTAVQTMVDHYDLGNDFYAAWLDPSMSYSSAIFEGEADLAAAQRLKYVRLAQLAGIKPGDRVLEIGCGWGAMAEYLAGELGCHVVGVTISREQHTYVVDRMQQAGLSDRVDVLLQDFRTIDGEFDRIVSVEMIESIDEAAWRDLYQVMARVLRPGGSAALQAITIDHDLHEAMVGRREFIRSYVFPGGALPSVDILRRLGRDVGLEDMQLTSHGPSYARTLALWDERFRAAWPSLRSQFPQFDEQFYRMWRYYLAYCEAGFRTGRIDGVQVGYHKPAPA